MHNLKNELLKLSDAIITDNSELILDDLKQNSRISRSKQLSVYTEGYIERLSKAIESDFPTLIYYFENYRTRKELGNIILSFIKQNPSGSYNLDKYPLGFYGFFQKNCDDEFAKDLSLLEHKIIEVFQASDSEPLLPESLANISEEQLANAKFKLRTASSLVDLNHDVEKFLSDFRSGNPSKPVKEKIYLYICRNNNEVKRNRLDEVEYHVLKKIGQGNSFSDSLNLVTSRTADAENIVAKNLHVWLSKWLINGFFDKYQ